MPGFPLDLAAPPQAISLTDAAGLAIEVTVESGTSGSRSLVVPSSPLAPGRYSMAVTAACGAGTVEAKRSFAIVESQPFPTELGELRAVRLPPGNVVVPAGARCALTAPADRVSIEIAASPSFASFRSVATLSVSVDGAPWAGPVVDDYARCDGQSDGGAAGAGIGKHTVEVRAHIEGAPAQPAPASIDIELACATPEQEMSTGASGCTAAPLRSETTCASIAGGLFVTGALVRRTLRRRR
ncbi:MAG: hypothetical protein KF819_08600 [Labilithrix sp.]|nr:hypothetical protein [Labilithrix sp.]